MFAKAAENTVIIVEVCGKIVSLAQRSTLSTNTLGYPLTQHKQYIQKETRHHLLL